MSWVTGKMIAMAMPEDLSQFSDLFQTLRNLWRGRVAFDAEVLEENTTPTEALLTQI